MSQYKVLESFELDGVTQEVDSLVELTDEQAVEFEGKVEAVKGDEPTPPAATEPTPPATPSAPSSEAATPPANIPSGDADVEADKQWAGNHTVGANAPGAKK